MLSAIIETLIGFTLFGGALLAGPSLKRLYQREPTPAFLRSGVISELIVLTYSAVLVLSFAVGLHGIL